MKTHQSAGHGTPRRRNTAHRACSALVLALPLWLSGCGGSSSPSQPAVTPAAVPPATLATLPVDTYAKPANPTHVSSSTDDSRAAMATVGTAGGTVTTTSADGSKFTLSIPPGALVADTDITMTPIAATTGAPWTRASGVRFAPDGLQFLQYATLAIEPATAVAVDHQVTLGALGGSELFLAQPDVSSAQTHIRVLHFTDYWLADMPPDQLSVQRLSVPTSALVQLEHEQAAILTRERQRQLLGASGSGVDIAAQMDAPLALWFDTVFKPLLNRNNSCAQWTNVQNTVLGVQRQRELLGLDGGNSLPDILNGNGGDLWGLAGSGAYWQANVPFAGSLSKAREFACAKDASAQCANQNQLGVVEMYLGNERQRQLLGVAIDAAFDTTYLQWDARSQACYRYSIKLDSEIKLSDTPGASVVDTTASTTLDYQPFKNGMAAGLSDQIAGTETLATAALNNSGLNVSSPSSCGSIFNVTPGGGVASGLLRTGKLNAGRRLATASVQLVLGNTAESWALSNCGAGTLRFGPKPVWTDSFLAAHGSEAFDQAGISRGVNLSLTQADLPTNGATLVSKRWQRSVGAIAEDSTLTVTHNPLPVVEPSLP